MQLSVSCPRCESKYQLDAGMRGKRMRCPNPICRAVFEVRDDADPPPAAPPVEMKPVEAPPLVAEQPKEAPPPVMPKPVEAKPKGPASSAIAAKAAEPKKPEPAKHKPIPKPIEPQPAMDFPDDFPGDDEAAPAPAAPTIATEAWQPEALETPPVREEVAPTPVRETISLSRPTPAPVKRRRALWVIAAMLLVLAVTAGGGYWKIRGGIVSNEVERFQKAEELYKDFQFESAAAALQKLHQDFPESEHNKKYRFLAELSDVRLAVYVSARESPDETIKAFGRVQRFVGAWKGDKTGDKLLKDHESDVWQTLERLATELTASAEREKAPGLLSEAKRAFAEAKKYPPPAGSSHAKRAGELEGEWTRIDQLLAIHVERERIIGILTTNLERANAASVQESWALVEKTKRGDDAEIRGLLDKMLKAHREQVRFVPAPSDAKLAIQSEDAFPSLSVTPSVKASTASVDPAKRRPLILSLARGVLYALEPATGDVRWARRVGIDTRVLPLRVPADAITPELLLTLSSDQGSLAGVIADTGETLWQTPLSDACLGQPVLADRQVLVPTRAGRIEEIEIAAGRRLGWYTVGQPLTLGGVRQPDSSLAYFPADEFCMYVIDIKERICTNILYTRHPAGSLHGLPAIAAGEKGPLLLWSQAKGLDQTEIKPYALPIEQHDAKPLEPTLVLPALSAPPWCDADRLAVLTETGLISLWGVRQKGTLDARLFPLLKSDFPIEAIRTPARCQVVHADAENFWTVTRGRLQRVQSAFDPKEGPGLLTRWTKPVPLGTPLHAAEARQQSDGRTILYLTTQADDRPTCLCSAIDAEDGTILWQRQLGVVPRQAPIRLAGRIVMRDANGLLRFDSGTPAPGSEKPWQPAGDWLGQDASADAVHFLLTREARYAHLWFPRGGTKLRVQLGSIAGADKPHVLEVTLAAPLQGTPAFGKDCLLVPTAEADGILVRVDLLDGSILKDLNWRAVGVEEQARGHVVLLSDSEGVLTDGSRGLARITCADGKSWTKKFTKTPPFAHRITAAPVIVPASADGKAKLCVVDASDTVTLLDAERLSVEQTWNLGGKITAGPFVRAGKIGCVVGRNQLVWLDPKQEKIVWEYPFADIVGEPNLIGDDLIVADVAGRFVALDPKDGAPRGTILTLKANVAATAAPLPFGEGRAFVPLTDGTIVLLPLQKLRK